MLLLLLLLLPRSQDQKKGWTQRPLSVRSRCPTAATRTLSVRVPSPLAYDFSFSLSLSRPDTAGMGELGQQGWDHYYCSTQVSLRYDVYSGASADQPVVVRGTHTPAVHIRVRPAPPGM